VNPEGDAGLYVPAAPGDIYPVQLGIHVGEDATSLAPRVREIALEVDPNVILGPPVALADVHQGDWYIMLLVTGGLALLVVILVALAASGIYAIMSFAVSERTREIGIRTALGARRSSIVFTILRRSLTQIGLGALLGMPLAARIFLEFQEWTDDSASASRAVLLALALAVCTVTLVGLLSCVGPTRRALGIEPSEALRADG
jgi:hypothetical protein